jgi:hypothetical protein
MRKPYVALVTAGLLLAVTASAEAGGRGGVGTTFLPPGLKSTNEGFTNTNSMKGSNITPYNTTTGGAQNYGPSGWSQGAQGNANAPNPWKGITSPTGSGTPPGLR